MLNTQNQNLGEPAKSSMFGRVIFYLLFILIIPIFIYISMRNHFIRLQQKINEAMGAIDAQLEEREDTLAQMSNSIQGQSKVTADIFKEITRLRTSGSLSDKMLANDKMTQLQGKFNLQVENYPDLQLSASFQQFNNTCTLLNQKIAAARRNYNSNVQIFNSEINVYPKNVAAKNMKLSIKEYFEASQEARVTKKAYF
ncbi:LemA family protein [Spiroplasma clarkii]|uniref:LemA protein n=1 Tax=Spiroplasma clarkii TaxID=2139 RepID=A0A1Y0L0I7_9MOLU|nr:LemA family protein [Spiroplasma clarkii]ARU91280.1 LemA family protein [Spiroplasma clarkii]ATX70717.1 LemA protein [Spiroplasma clarkii]